MAARLIGLRERLKKSLEGHRVDQIAEELKLTPSAVYGWLEGMREPRLEALSRFALATGVTFGWLVTGERPMTGSIPIPMLLWCPQCHERHIDAGEFAHKSHHTHACQFCGHVWRPALVETVGVQFLPGFKDE